MDYIKAKKLEIISNSKIHQVHLKSTTKRLVIDYTKAIKLINTKIKEKE